MSFNDLERGATSSPPPIRSSSNNSNNNNNNNAGTGGLNGQQYLNGSGRSNRNNNARGPLPLYHAPRSSSDSGNHETPSAPVQSDPEFKRLAERIGIQVFKLNSNVQGIDKLVELQLRKMRSSGNQTAATTKASDKDWTAQIHDLTESTRALVKDLSGSIKGLAGFQPSSLSQTDRLTAIKLQRDFESAINAFAKAQRESAKLSRSMLDGAKEERERTLRAASSSSGQDANKVAVNETLVQIDDAQSPEGQQQLQQQEQRQSNEPSQAEIEFQETLIAERESEIREIESGIQELNEIFRDLGHIVQEQGGMIDNIEYNVQTIATNTGAADRELVSASDYQRKAGRRAACLMLVVGFVVAVVLLAILS
ncbi:t-SNARE [Meira miltonrushii]|uniref:t-SNARE n=1 Tax=Meira miltonrushii TaxID=1280837 RepID=A0A316VGU2_9BASI|nr:t-SNARE [Meira miltonrushii]PWN36756.1 t-SNARE [Meira miltonrushii]